MVKSKSSMAIPFIVLITYTIMIIVNALANILPINGKGTGEISDSYKNLFTPAGITFAIWGLIYLLLLIYTIYQLIQYKNANDAERKFFNEVGLLFSISSIANSLWIFAWHYEVIALSLLLMLVILLCLIKINIIIKNTNLSFKEKITVKLPFTVYLGWITVATIANVTIFLVSIPWDGSPFSEVFWTILIIMVGAVIGYKGVQFYESIAFGAVLIWAYIGIIIKHLSPEQFACKYPSVIATALISIVLILVSIVILIRNRMKARQR